MAVTPEEKVAALMETARLQNIGEGHSVIKQIKAIAANTKPNPKKLFVSEGFWLTKLVLDNSLPVETAIICPECIHTHECAVIAERLIDTVPNNVFTVSKKVFEHIAEMDKPDGVMCVAALSLTDPADLAFDNKAVVLILDGIEIPGNMGTLIRVADGAGTDAVFIVNRKARLTHPKFIRSTMGAAFTVPIVEFASVDDCYDYLSSKGFTTYLADSRAEKMYYALPYGGRTAFVMGSERYGISRTWYDKKTELVAIPMLGKCDSLNVGVAGTILLYDAAVKNKLGGK